MINTRKFDDITSRLINGPLREALGFTIEREVPYFRGITGYMVTIPMLWIRHSRFPIFFVAYDRHCPDILEDLVRQLENARATEHFALLVVVPTKQGTGNEAEELRHVVNGSVFRHDFVVLDRQHLESIIAGDSAHRLIEILLQQGVDLSSLSPYVVRGPVPENMFFGREQEIKTVSQAVQQGNCAIVGGRRIGKSSLLQSLTRLLNNHPRQVAHYINCEATFSGSDFVSSLRVLTNESAATIDSVGLRRLIALLRAQQPERQLVLILDEVDAMLEADALAEPRCWLFKTFRALAHEGECRFVFSGSRTLWRHLHDAASPFFNFCDDMTLGPLEERSVAEIVSEPMRQLGVDLPDEDNLIGRVIEATSCHPSLVQWMCDKLLRSTKTRQITTADVAALASDPEYLRHYLETAWGDARPRERLVSVLPEQQEFTMDALLRAAPRHRLLTQAAIREALDILEFYRLVSRRGNGFTFVLKQFPVNVRLAEDVPLLVDNWLQQMEG